MLQRQIVPIALNQGINNKTDPKQNPIGTLNILENAVFTTINQLSKRKGYTNLTTNVLSAAGSPTITAGVSAHVYNTVPSIFDGYKFYTYAPENTKWVESSNTYASSKLDVSTIGPASSTTYEGVGSQLYVLRAAASDTTEAYIYPLSDKSLELAIYSPAGQDVKYKVVFTTANVINAFTIQAIANTFYVGIVEANPAGNDPLTLYSFSSATPVTSWPAALATIDNTRLNILTLDSDVLGTSIYFSYITDTGHSIASYNTSGGAVATANIATTVVSTSIACDQVAGVIYLAGLASGGAGNLVVTSRNTSLGVTNTYTNTTTANNQVVVGANNGRAVAVVTASNLSTQVWTLGGSVTVFSNLRPYGTVGSKIAWDSTNLYLVFRSAAALQSAYFLCTYRLAVSETAPSAGRLISRIAYGEASQDPQKAVPNLTFTNNQLSFSFTAYKTTFYRGDLLVAGFEVPQSSINSATVTLSQKPQGTVAGGVLNLTGGNPVFFDGLKLQHIGFNTFPAINSITQSTSGVGNIVPGNYSYITVFSFSDNRGRIIRSAPSPASPAVLTGPHNAFRVVADIAFFNSYDTVTCELYRTTDGGTVYYLASETTSTLTGSSLTFTIDDTTSDASLVSRLQLYTNGGEVDNIAPPPSRIGCVYKTRYMLVPDEGRTSIWYSKDMIPGSPVEFSDLFVQNVDPRGGAITALAQMDDKLIIFKNNNIFYMIGDGPAPNGSNNDFLNPQLLPTDVGCVDRDSVVLTPDGLLFKSAKGIYLLGRNLSVSYLGAPVENYNSFTVTSALLMEPVNQVRFTLNTGAVLVYDYFVQQWSVFKPITAVDSVIYNGAWTHLTSNGVMHVESNGYLDNTSPIVMKLQTSWLNFAGVQGFQRARRLLILGEWKSAHNLSVSFAQDFNPAITQTSIIDSPTIQIPYEYRVHIQRQKAASLQITIEDSPDSPFGESLTLSNLALEVGVKQGLNKVSAAKSVG